MTLVRKARAIPASKLSLEGCVLRCGMLRHADSSPMLCAQHMQLADGVTVAVADFCCGTAVTSSP